MPMLFFSRCFFWVIVIHLSTMFKQWPWVVLFGLLLAPYFYICGLLTPTKTRNKMSLESLRDIIKETKAGTYPMPPIAIFEKLEGLEREATILVHGVLARTS